MTERDRASEFAKRLQDLFSDRLVSAVLYGSAARGEYKEGTSDLNILVILSELGSPELHQAGSLTREWVEKGNPPPLMMSAEEWRSSADVFPIEYTDIRDAHLLLAGREPFDGITVDREHLRLQLEHELRSKKIQLREGFLAAGDSGEARTAILIRSLSTFLTTFRAILRLSGRAVPNDAGELIASTAERVGFDPQPVQEVLTAKKAGKTGKRGKGSPVLGPQTADGYLRAIEQSVRWLDEYEPRPDAPAEV